MAAPSRWECCLERVLACRQRSEAIDELRTRISVGECGSNQVATQVEGYFDARPTHSGGFRDQRHLGTGEGGRRLNRERGGGRKEISIHASDVIPEFRSLSGQADEDDEGEQSDGESEVESHGSELALGVHNSVLYSDFDFCRESEPADFYERKMKIAAIERIEHKDWKVAAYSQVGESDFVALHSLRNPRRRRKILPAGSARGHPGRSGFDPPNVWGGGRSGGPKPEQLS